MGGSRNRGRGRKSQCESGEDEDEGEKKGSNSEKNQMKEREKRGGKRYAKVLLSRTRGEDEDRRDRNESCTCRRI